MNYLAAQTVKSLHSVAKIMGLTGYSKLRKAELVAFLTERINGWHVIALDMDRANYAAPVKILDVTEVADQPEIVKIMSSVAPAVIKPAQSAPKRVKVATPTATPESLVLYGTDALITAYRGYRATALKMGNTPTRIKIVIKAREIATILKSRKVNMREV